MWCHLESNSGPHAHKAAHQLTVAPSLLLFFLLVFFGRLKKIEAKIYAIPCEILNNRHFFRLPKVTFFFSNCLSVGKFLNINKGEELKLVDFMRKCEIHRQTFRKCKEFCCLLVWLLYIHVYEDSSDCYIQAPHIAVHKQIQRGNTHKFPQLVMFFGKDWVSRQKSVYVVAVVECSLFTSDYKGIKSNRFRWYLFPVYCNQYSRTQIHH